MPTYTVLVERSTRLRQGFGVLALILLSCLVAGVPDQVLADTTRLAMAGLGVAADPGRFENAGLDMGPNLEGDLEDGFRMETVVSDLTAPVDIAFVPDGRMFVAETAGRVRVVKDGTLLTQPLLDISDRVNNFWDRGLLSIALDPDFALNGFIYLAYTYENPGSDPTGPQTNRITRVKLDPVTADVMTPQKNPPETVLLGSITQPHDDGTDTPCRSGSDCMPADSPSHDIGQIVFAPDKTLYLSLGEGASFFGVDPRALRAQDLDWLSGKVLHVDRDGRGLPSNPFYNGDPDAPRSKIYHYGLRNPFRIHLHPEKGLYVNDVGWASWEEINNGPPGSNFGWPCYEGNGKQPLYSQDDSTAIACQAVYSKADHVQPGHTYPTGATPGTVIGGAFFQGTSYPAGFRDNYFFGDYSRSYIKRLVFDSAGQVESVQDFFNTAAGVVKVFSFADGSIGWISIWTGRILKFVHTTSGPPDTTPPTVVGVTASGEPPKVTVEFSEPVDKATAEDPASYSISRGVAVTGASLADDLRTVILTPSSLSKGLAYTLAVQGVTDRAIALNAVAANTQVAFDYQVEIVWVEDELPAGAVPSGIWNWTTSDPSPFSGQRAHRSITDQLEHQHHFLGAQETLVINNGDTLLAYVYLNPNQMPIEMMLQWYAGDWEHRAYWGGNFIGFGEDGTPSRRYMGPLPSPRHWVRLEVPAERVGLEGKTVTGMAFTLRGGAATWDYAGKVEAPEFLPADFNLDGVVDVADLTTFVAAMTGSRVQNPRVDINGDDRLDVLDLAQIAVTLDQAP